MLMDSKIARLEDFGVRNATTPEERLKVYQDQCKGLPKVKQALFWAGVLDADPEVAKLLREGGKRTVPRKRRVS